MADVVGVVTDLFFQSRISAAAKVHGLDVKFVVPGAVESYVGPGYLALVDLDARGDVLEVIREFKNHFKGPVVAFGPHLDAPRLKAARSAGADRVMAKSKFVTELPRLMGSARKAKDSPAGSTKGAELDDV